MDFPRAQLNQITVILHHSPRVVQGRGSRWAKSKLQSRCRGLRSLVNGFTGWSPLCNHITVSYVACSLPGQISSCAVQMYTEQGDIIAVTTVITRDPSFSHLHGPTLALSHRRSSLPRSTVLFLQFISFGFVLLIIPLATETTRDQVAKLIATF